MKHGYRQSAKMRGTCGWGCEQRQYECSLSKDITSLQTWKLRPWETKRTAPDVKATVDRLVFKKNVQQKNAPEIERRIFNIGDHLKNTTNNLISTKKNLRRCASGYFKTCLVYCRTLDWHKVLYNPHEMRDKNYWNTLWCPCKFQQTEYCDIHLKSAIPSTVTTGHAWVVKCYKFPQFSFRLSHEKLS